MGKQLALGLFRRTLKKTVDEVSLYEHECNPNFWEEKLWRVGRGASLSGNNVVAVVVQAGQRKKEFSSRVRAKESETLVECVSAGALVSGGW